MSAAEEARARANTNRLGKIMAREMDKDILALRKAADELDARDAILAEALAWAVEHGAPGDYPSEPFTFDKGVSAAATDVHGILSKLPAEALAARDADKWDEGATSALKRQGYSVTESDRKVLDRLNPYRIEREAEQ